MFFLNGCLKTRTDVKETETKQVMAQQVVTLQKTNADTSNRMSEIEQEVRELKGEIEVTQNKISKGNPDQDKSIKALQEQVADLIKKFQTHQEELLKQQSDIKNIQNEIESIKAEKAKNIEKESEKKSNWQMGEDSYKAGDWKKAIIQYQKYRDENPSGKKVSEATYKIALSFQELEMKEEAKTFFEEVVSKYPHSSEAKKSKKALLQFGPVSKKSKNK